MAGKKPIDPTPETYKGHNFPYRGIEKHGVRQTSDPSAPPEHTLTHIDWAETELEPEAIPVRVVNEGTRERRYWNGSVFFIRETARIVGQDDTRLSLHITNDGPDDVYLAPDASLVTSPTLAPIKLLQGGTFDTVAQNEVYASVASGDSASLRVVWEIVKVI